MLKNGGEMTVRKSENVIVPLVSRRHLLILAKGSSTIRSNTQQSAAEYEKSVLFRLLRGAAYFASCDLVRCGSGCGSRPELWLSSNKKTHSPGRKAGTSEGLDAGADERARTADLLITKYRFP